MALTVSQRLERVRVRSEELRYWRAREGVAVTGWSIDGSPIELGGACPSRDGVHKFAATAEVPSHWPLEEARLVLDLGGESLVMLSYPNHEAVSFGVDPYHREFPLRHRPVAIGAELKTQQQQYPQQGEIQLSGHAHIDLAWLWPYAETRRMMRRTFHTALGHMDVSDDYRFNQSTAHYYAQMEEDDPAVLKAIKARAASGQWETVGGLWVEPDTNMPTGESLVRQALYGQRI